MNDSKNSQKAGENVRPPFPPVITAKDLIPTEVSNKVESVRIPNAFIAYRMALVRQLKLQKVATHRSTVSSLASRLWAEEPEHVKNTYRKMATDAQMLHNQARGLTFLSYEQSTSTDNVMQDDNSDIINNSPQDIEAEILALFNHNLQIQSSLQQQGPMLTPPPIYYDNIPATSVATSSAPLFDQYNNNIGMTGKSPNSLEQRVHVLEQQMALFFQLYQTYQSYLNYN